MSKLISSLQSLVSAEQLSDWETVAPSLKAQLSQAIAPGVMPECVVQPDTPAQLAAVMKELHWQKGRSLPLGAGTKLHWGGTSGPIQVGISTIRMNQLIDHAAGDLTVTAQAGMRLADLQLERKIKGTSCPVRLARKRRQNSSPSISGIRTSDTTRSGGCCSNKVKPSSPDRASCTK